MENLDNRNIMPEIVICPALNKVTKLLGKLTMLPSETDPTHLKRGAAEVPDEYQPELPFEPELPPRQTYPSLEFFEDCAEFPALYIDRSRV